MAEIKPTFNRFFKQKSPQEILNELVDGYNDLEFEQAKEETFRKMEYYKTRINEILKENPELIPLLLKQYTW